jgi:hypothetical protein
MFRDSDLTATWSKCCMAATLLSFIATTTFRYIMDIALGV